MKLKGIPEQLLAKVKEAQENVEKLFGDHDFIAGDSLTVADYSYITIMDILAVNTFFLNITFLNIMRGKWIIICKYNKYTLF